jgi:hypothetical protein
MNNVRSISLNPLMQVTQACMVFSLLAIGARAADPPKEKTEKRHSARSEDPANFIEVIEESGNNRILHYYPGALYDHLRSRQFKVDTGSTLLLRIVPEELNPDTALSGLTITAVLKHSSDTTPVEVKGYSEVGKSQAGGQAQNAVNINSILGVAAQIEAWQPFRPPVWRPSRRPTVRGLTIASPALAPCRPTPSPRTEKQPS